MSSARGIQRAPTDFAALPGRTSRDEAGFDPHTAGIGVRLLPIQADREHPKWSELLHGGFSTPLPCVPAFLRTWSGPEPVGLVSGRRLVKLTSSAN